ncbi:ClpP/crotonase-like domain-containing protein [Suillus fuscotomentosus]|uniref:ClpP/crotonase-like domain-containing protein n=1 Tax=Suillus fuscotomentosus TaxID=1912939 RepID=A0AAD4EGI2_9AGAM|nr:ClpP/crotonase-like domain-containing protein [Suillus fuscotomentosus]KAG1905722.1 ClpP/crotonase-like domain-containing protein [Suillus fuscotomentosus]
MPASKISVNVSQGIATITLNEPHRLNALTPEDYNEFANSLRAIDEREDVVATVWKANGKWFCAGTDVKRTTSSEPNTPTTQRSMRDCLINGVVAANTDCTHAIYSHSKILVAALNGPVMGIAAAFLGNFDFIYAVPEAWLNVGFPFLGIAVEGGASVSFVSRMGIAKANEVLLLNKKISASEMLECGFVNKIFPSKSTEEFHSAVHQHLKKELDGLVPASIFAIKTLIKAGLNDKNNFHAVNLRESYAQAERFSSGIPAERFGKIARKEIKHKL